jgi:hypothetical protein
MPPSGTTFAPPLTADDITAALDADPRISGWRRQLLEPVALQLPTILGELLTAPFTLENLILARLRVVTYYTVNSDFLDGVGGLPGMSKELIQRILGEQTMTLNNWLRDVDGTLRVNGLTEQQVIRNGPPPATVELETAWADGVTIADALLIQISYVLIVT